MNKPINELFHVTLLPEGRVFTAGHGESVLNAALRAGINLPHSCKGGSCGLCRARVVDGTVYYPFGAPVGLSTSELQQGYALLCEAHPSGDLRIDIQEIQPAGQVRIQHLPCRVVRKRLLAPDVMALHLQLPLVANFTFKPGQYLDVMLSDGRRRSFSIASPPHETGSLELHIRRAAGGEFSQHVFAALAEGSLLHIEGPLGQFYYRDDVELPALLIGGGTGFAPLKSMIRHVLENKVPRVLHFYWGARRSQDLYEDSLVRQWVAAHGNLRYTPVLSEPDASWGGRTGLVHRAAFSDCPDLSRMEVYASGPPAMIEAIKAESPRYGLMPASLHFDSFEYAPDALEKIRQRSQLTER